jgi:phospholipid/cholesterol/gamma-HCH transport system permease protein
VAEALLGFAGRTQDAVSAFLVPYLAFKGAWLERGKGRRYVVGTAAAQVYFTAIQPLLVFTVIGLVAGVVVTFAADSLLRENGLGNFVPNVIMVGVVRELLPVLLSLVLIGRSGNAVTTELGYMRVNQEVDALAVAGINIDYAIALPRVVGMTIASVGLVVYTSFVAVVGGFAACSLLHLVSPALDLDHIGYALDMKVVGLALLKAVAFGVIISSVSCHFGLAVGRSFTEIPRANARASVLSLFFCFAVDAVLATYAFSS